MSNQTYAVEQLLELLLQLKKTTPKAARDILNNQPPIAYALMTLMVSMNAVNIDVFQKTLTEFSSSKPATPAVPSVSSTPVPAIPQHMQTAQSSQYRTATPPGVPPPPPSYPYSNGHGAQPAYSGGGAPVGGGYGQQYSGYNYGQPPSGYQAYPPSYGAPAPTAPASASAPSTVPDALAAIPDEQKALIVRVLSMTPEQINMLPPQERNTYIQLRATLGVPT